jgi:16S rRNA processing protein RimM
VTRPPAPQRDSAPAAGPGPGGADICVARIGAAHGVRGEVRLWTFTDDPLAVAAYGPLSTRDGTRQFALAKLREAKGHLVACLEGVTTREAAQALNGVELYVARDRLPAPNDDEFYHADLIGLRAVTPAGSPLGRIIAVHNFGAGDVIEIKGEGVSELLPFDRATVPAIDLAQGFAVIERPGEIDGEPPPDGE